MKYAAVIFDLFGTLIDNMSLSEHRTVLTRMAHVLSAPPDDFAQLWFGTFNERSTGIFQSPDDNVEYICRTLGVSVNETQVKLAARIRFDYTVQSMVPRPDAIETLSHLKFEGYKTGLVSDCSAEVPAIWQDTPFAPLFDVTIFSCMVGLKKPDPQIYQLATNQLEVKPQECLYIGDGSSKELSGATQVGMNPILIRTLDDPADAHQIEAEEWDGPVISSLKEVLALAK
ncbi:HAD family hydrolase [Chloroflexota bacterium]